MKFTKTLAISLLTFGAMQLAHGTQKILQPGTTYIPSKAGDTIELNIPENLSTGYEVTIVKTPNYLKATENPYVTQKSTKTGRSSVKTIQVSITSEPTNDPLIIQNKRNFSGEVADTYTIYFHSPAQNTAKSTPSSKHTKKTVSDIDLTETGEISLIDLIQASGENKALFETGDIIHLILPENPTTGFRLMLPTELPKYLKKLCETYEAPARRPMVFNPTSCQMEEAEPMTGVSGKKHLVFEITSLKNLTAEELSKPLIISSARSWETDRPETYKISFKLPPTVVATSETKPASVMERPIKPSGSK